MLENQERTALLILISVLCVCGLSTLVLEDLGKKPFAQNYSSSVPEGHLVYYEGIIQKIVKPDSADVCILEMNAVQVFIPSYSGNKILVNEGDVISLYGKVQTWKGKREIVVEEPNDITVIGVSLGNNLRF